MADGLRISLRVRTGRKADRHLKAPRRRSSRSETQVTEMLSDRLYRLDLPPCTREDGKFLTSNWNVPIACNSQFHPITANLNDPHIDFLANHNLLICPSTEYQHQFTSEEPKYMGTSAVVDENAHHVAPSLGGYTLPQAR